MVIVAQSMNKNAQSHVRANGTFSEDFLGQVRLHQGSVLGPLLFIIRLQALSRENMSRWPEDRLYADDLSLVSKTLYGLKGRLEA